MALFLCVFLFCLLSCFFMILSITDFSFLLGSIKLHSCVFVKNVCIIRKLYIWQFRNLFPLLFLTLSSYLAITSGYILSVLPARALKSTSIKILPLHSSTIIDNVFQNSCFLSSFSFSSVSYLFTILSVTTSILSDSVRPHFPYIFLYWCILLVQKLPLLYLHHCIFSHNNASLFFNFSFCI